ncbi:hypothetical protein A6E15_07440 [Natrinema saccharevitans]|uniref:Gins51 C-terminal domain-containing protein n=1 Tax=Natrinema saccharevitans TaxID=301967 RepID=A0A1S8AVE3_9EURY|nr:hypothetical protein [Natrinema saccharevitans]OLZ40833.1 hypothetical protein A6E15_07440 [Natrinema saccharevitans]
MNLDELRSVQSKERQKDSLQNLRPSFYQEVGEYIADLEAERDRVAEASEDPFSSPEVGRLTDEIETAKDVVEAIYERRMGKLVKQASLAAAGMPADDEGLTAEEADLFDDLVDRIGSNKSRVLDVLEGVEESTGGGDAAPSNGTPAPEPRDADAGRPGSPSNESAPDPDAPPAPPEEPPAGPAAPPEGSDSSGVSPADVMGGEGPAVDGPADVGGSSDSNTPPESSVESGSDPVSESGPTTDRDGAVDRDGTASESTAGTDDLSISSDSAVDAVADAGRGDEPATNDDVARTTVRITDDIGSILGVDDREYTLTSDDIVELPEQNAAPFVERGAAERLE